MRWTGKLVIVIGMVAILRTLLLFSRLLQLCRLQHARLPCPSLSPRDSGQYGIPFTHEILRHEARAHLAEGSFPYREPQAHPGTGGQTPGLECQLYADSPFEKLNGVHPR